MSDTKRAHLIANSKSGKGKGATLAELAQKICHELDWELIHHKTETPDDLAKQSKLAVSEAMNDGGLVIAAGGDGTIRGVAQAAYGKPVRFAVVPCGTFNFFARTHHIPEDPEQAFRLALTNEARPVRLGAVNNNVFLINASLGLYAKSIRERESRTSRFGRNRWVVILSTIYSMFSDHRLLKVDLVEGQTKTTLKTPMIFIGNNALQLRDLALKVVRCLNADALGVIMLKPLRKLELFRVLLRGIFKTLEKDEKLDTFCVDELTIHTRKPINEVALDGEIIHVPSPLRVHALPGALNLVLPSPAGPGTSLPVDLISGSGVTA